MGMKFVGEYKSMQASLQPSPYRHRYLALLCHRYHRTRGLDFALFYWFEGLSISDSSDGVGVPRRTAGKTEKCSVTAASETEDEEEGQSGSVAGT